MVFTDKWPLFAGDIVFIIREWLLKFGLYLQGGLYWEVVFNTALTIYEIISSFIYFKRWAGTVIYFRRLSYIMTNVK